MTGTLLKLVLLMSMTTWYYQLNGMSSPHDNDYITLHLPARHNREMPGAAITGQPKIILMLPSSPFVSAVKSTG